jgi:hypothetical protein
MRRAQHIAEGHSWKDHVPDVTAAALDKSYILEAGDRLANGEFTHCVLALQARRGSIDPSRKSFHYLKNMPGGRPGIKQPVLTR